MAFKIILSIGGDNKTGKVSEEYENKADEIINKYWKNFKLIKHKGRFEGVREESLSAIIIVLELILQDLKDCIDELKVTLVQKTIGLEITANVDFKLM